MSATKSLVVKFRTNLKDTSFTRHFVSLSESLVTRLRRCFSVNGCIVVYCVAHAVPVPLSPALQLPPGHISLLRVYVYKHRSGFLHHPRILCVDTFPHPTSRALHFAPAHV